MKKSILIIIFCLLSVAASCNKDNPNDSDKILKIEMVFVEGGTFTMGCTDGECQELKGFKTNDVPAHEVTVDGFYIGMYEITQAQWRTVMGKNPSQFEGDSFPVKLVSWLEIQEFIAKLNILTGKNYRLPTEAEWEFAARGGVKSKGYKYSGSNNIDEVAWYSENSNKKTRRVGTKTPNELGIYDMSGNVFEWCSDWLGEYSETTQTNPQGPSSGKDRIIRGGDYLNNTSRARISSRVAWLPGFSPNDFGFRLACSSQ